MTAETRAASDLRTDWPVVLVATFGGAAGAMQVGKASSALPLIRAEFGADVSFLALYISLISLIAASVGIGFGVISGRIGIRRSASLGLVLIAIGSLLGAAAPSPGVLLGSRLIEALGFTLSTTAFPAVVRMGAGTRQQSLALGIWAVWMPLGVAMAMGVAAMSLDLVGWRGLFVVTAVLPLIALGALWRIVPRPATAPTRFRLRKSVVLRPEVLLTAALFAVFSGTSLIYMGFLPTILVDTMGLAPARANLVALLAMLCLVPTNVIGGQWLDRGVPAVRLLLMAFGVMLATPWIMLADDASHMVRYAAMGGFALAAGLPAAVIWTSVGRLARHPDEAPVLSGMIYQGAAMGQIAGPMLVGVTFDIVQSWYAAVWTMTLLCAVAVLLSLALARYDRAAALPS